LALAERVAFANFANSYCTLEILVYINTANFNDAGNSSGAIAMQKTKSLKELNIELMSTEDLWALHERLAKLLSARISSEKRELEKRLAMLGHPVPPGQPDAAGAARAITGKRSYPRVFPKYRNPAKPLETWSGRGKKPRWLVAALRSGRAIEDFKIST
jgi:DNA-binding protein H-NS